jgi:tellurium resistance protein TerD
MSKGDIVTLPSESSRYVIGLGWTPKPKTVVDLDLSCLALTRAEDGFLYPRDIVNGEQEGNRVIRPGLQHMGDNVTGEVDGDDESIVIDFSSLDNTVSAVAILVCARGMQGESFADVKDAHFRVLGFETHEVHACIGFGGKRNMPGVVFCIIERQSANGPWVLTVTTEDFAAKSVLLARCGLWKSFFSAMGQKISSAEAAPLLNADEWHAYKIAAALAHAPPTPPQPEPAARPFPAVATPTSADTTAAADPVPATAQPPAPAAAPAPAQPPVTTSASIGPVEDLLADAVLLSNQTGNVEVDLSWPMEVGSGAADLDISAACFTGMGVLVDAAYFNQSTAVDGAVVHSGDSRCGEKITISLADVRGVRVIVFVVSGYSGADTHVCDGAVCTIKVGREHLATISLGDAFTARNPSMVLCMLFAHRDDRKWHFAQIRRPAKGRTFENCMNVIQAAVDQVIDEGLIAERSLTAGRAFNMRKCDYATVPRDFHRLLVGLGWHSQLAPVDLDLSCLMLTRDENGALTPMDMANTKHSLAVRPGVQHFGDNTTGGGEDGDQERILVDLTAVEDSVEALAFVVTIQHSKQSFKDVRDSYVRITSEDASQVYASFALGDNLTKNAVIFCTLTRGRRRDLPWTLVTIGEEGPGKSARHLISRHWVSFLAAQSHRASTTPAEPMVEMPEPVTPRTPPAASVPVPVPAAVPAPAVAPTAASAVPTPPVAGVDVSPPPAPVALPAGAAEPTPASTQETLPSVLPPAAPEAGKHTAQTPPDTPKTPLPPQAVSALTHEVHIVDNPNAACCVIS